MLAEQEFSIDAVGRMLLHAEGPRLTRTFGDLDYELTVTGLGDASTTDHALVITPDQRARTVGRIVALVFAAIGFLASLGLSIAIVLIHRR